MKINVLVCNPDGSQAMEEREVADDWFGATETETETVRDPSPEEDRDAMAVDHEYRLTTLELGVNSDAVQNA